MLLEYPSHVQRIGGYVWSKDSRPQESARLQTQVQDGSRPTSY